MLLLEIAAQGVKGISFAGGTARLRPGYNVVAADGPALRRLLDALLFPTGVGAEALRAGASTGAARAGMTLVGADGATYRIVRDLAAGCELHRFDPHKRAFALASRDLADIVRQLEGVPGLPSADRLGWLTLSAAELPSRSRASSASAIPVPARRARSPEETEARRAELLDELERARRAEKLQYQLDGLQTRLFKVEETLKEEARLQEEVRSTQAALDAVAPVAAVAAGLGELSPKLASHAKAVAKRDEALARAEAERAALQAAAEQGPPRAFWEDPKFWGGVVAGLAAAALGLAGAGRGLRVVALLDIPAFGWAAWVALGWVTAREDEGRRERRSKLIEEHERKALDAFEVDTAELRDARKALGVKDITELRDALMRLSDHQVAAEAARQRLEAFRARPETRASKEEKARVQAELHEAESALAGTVGGYLRDPRAVEQDLQRLDSEDLEPATAAGPATSVEPIRDLLERAGRELNATPAGAVRAVQAAASQAIKALSGGRFGAVGVDDRGNLLVQVGGRASPAAQLVPQDRDLAFLALKLAFLDATLARGGLFALADDAFAGLPEPARRQAGRILKLLARPGQLVHATADVAFRESADNAA